MKKKGGIMKLPPLFAVELSEGNLVHLICKLARMHCQKLGGGRDKETIQKMPQ